MQRVYAIVRSEDTDELQRQIERHQEDLKLGMTSYYATTSKEFPYPDQELRTRLGLSDGEFKEYLDQANIIGLRDLNITGPERHIRAELRHLYGGKEWAKIESRTSHIIEEMCRNNHVLNKWYNNHYQAQMEVTGTTTLEQLYKDQLGCTYINGKMVNVEEKKLRRLIDYSCPIDETSLPDLEVITKAKESYQNFVASAKKDRANAGNLLLDYVRHRIRMEEHPIYETADTILKAGGTYTIARLLFFDGGSKPEVVVKALQEKNIAAKHYAISEL